MYKYVCVAHSCGIHVGGVGRNLLEMKILSPHPTRPGHHHMRRHLEIIDLTKHFFLQHKEKMQVKGGREDRPGLGRKCYNLYQYTGGEGRDDGWGGNLVPDHLWRGWPLSKTILGLRGSSSIYHLLAVGLGFSSRPEL